MRRSMDHTDMYRSHDNNNMRRSVDLIRSSSSLAGVGASMISNASIVKKDPFMTQA